MYTYESFEILGAFTLLRPVFITFLVISLLLFVTVLLPKPKTKFLNLFTVISISIISLIVSTQVLYYDAIIVDEIGLGGDEVTTYMYIIVAVFSIINPLIYFVRK
ncbi:hypothetical protein [Pseudalkalibacillus berkeleyi]|uniref:Uncharacterized protein n=1 Tax=Pseudalkalibacillus berkeleyi TaxID=1069813 RepID=A0ABS9GY11_9BACL|nr:hypothetical protein [Pseudalkalibacillus berkeleyi]MCF6136590.1 hypothetical protein [Pseudalkalibacillus berkeleyi]